jgi:flagellar hook-associated protein 1 FlgK
MTFYKDPADTMSSIMFTGTANGFMTGLIGELSLDVELNGNFSDTSSYVLNNLFASRESISGVSLDEEGINLMAFQKSYNAAARYFTALDEAIDKIINGMGLVGR